VIGLRVTSNFREFERWLADMATKQVPFATAKALTKTAQDAQAAQRAALPQRFKLRSNWVMQGIRIVPASKRDWPRSHAIVGSKDEFLVLQETGGRKRPAKGAKNVAVPTAATERRRGAGGRLPKSAKPRAIISSKAGFFADRAIKRRQARKATGARALTLFLLRPSATIKPRLKLRETVERTVARVYQARFREALDDAVRAPRRKPTR
jgi:hypothetical protein